MAILTTQLESAVSGSPTMAAASAGGDQWRNTGREALWILNSSGSSIDVTVAGTGRCRHGFLDGEVITVGAGQLLKTRTFSPKRFNDEDGLASIAYTSATLVTIAVVLQESYAG